MKTWVVLVVMFLGILGVFAVPRATSADFISLRDVSRTSIAKNVTIGESLAVVLTKGVIKEQALLPGASSSAVALRIDNRARKPQQVELLLKFFREGRELKDKEIAGIRPVFTQQNQVIDTKRSFEIPAQGIQGELYLQALPGAEPVQADEVFVELRRQGQTRPISNTRLVEKLEVQESIAFERLPDFSGENLYGVARDSITVINNFAEVRQHLILGFEFQDSRGQTLEWKWVQDEVKIRVLADGGDVGFRPGKSIALPAAKGLQPGRTLLTILLEFSPGPNLAGTKEIFFVPQRVLEMD